MSESSIVTARVVCQGPQAAAQAKALHSAWMAHWQQQAGLYLGPEGLAAPGPAGKDTCTLVWGRSYRNVEHCWANWLGEWEALLRLGAWHSAQVQLETQMQGTQHYHWYARRAWQWTDTQAQQWELHAGKLWYFGVGLRNWWGHPLRPLGASADFMDASCS